MKQIIGFEQFNQVENILEQKLVHPIIYVDLDGTLVDFEAGAVKVLGPEFKSHQKDQDSFWKKLAPPHVKNFFGTLEWLPGAKAVWERIKPFKPTVLTATENAWAVPQKKKWVADHLGANVHVIITRSTEKSKHSGHNKILIDDRSDIIYRWKKAGGIGIHYTHAEKVLEKLNAILP